MWYKKVSKDSDVVVSSRIRYARNVSGHKFPTIMNNVELKKIIEIVGKNIDKTNYSLFKIDDIDEITQNSLKEKNLISKEMLNNKYGAIVTNKDNSLVCMINEEDHLRIQTFKAGFDIDECYEKLLTFTDKLSEKIIYSKSDKYGYLTSCPTNVGSGMRVSVMLHLPALKKIGMLSQVLEQVSSIGFSVRGIYGENSDSLGNMYQISNRKTLGMADKEIIENFKIVITYVVESERKARDLLKKDIAFIDELYRAYGILKNARVISSNEAMKLLSNVRLGVVTEIIKEISLENVQSLMVEIQKNTLKLILKQNYQDDEENMVRANYIRKVME